MSYKKIIILIIFLFAFLKVFNIIINDNNISLEKEKKITGKITGLKKDEDKTVIDVKDKYKYRITIYNDFDYELGDNVSVTGLFKTPNNNTVFNLFNYRKYLLTKNIKMISNNPKITLISKNKNLLYTLKNKMIKHTNKYKTKAYLKAFVLADTSNIESYVMKGYRNIGISHLFAISGMHVVLFLSIINKMFKNLKLKKIIIFLFLLFFLFITGFTESLLRCSLFLALSHINRKLNLNYKDINVLLMTASILLIINPYLIYSVSFMFSITITFFILLSKKILRSKNYFKNLLIISVVCFLSSIPILASNFFKINILSFVFNLFFVPFVSIIIFPLGVITFMFPFLDSLYLLFIKLLEYLTINLDKIKIFTFVISKPSIVVVILYYLFLYLMIIINKKYLILYLVILIFNLNSKIFIMNPEIVFLDVGQGDSTVMILPRGKAIIIDTGGNVFSKSKIIENKTIPYLNSRGINSIEFLILTHGDYDHMGEAMNLVESIKIKNVVLNNDDYNEIETKLIKLLNEKNINYYKGLEKLNIDKHQLKFLNTRIYDNENDNSNVIYYNFNNYKFLFMGDAGIKKEEDILKKYDLKDIDFLKVGHHGSDTSSGLEFINSINPKYSIISVGKNNRYNHPKQSVLNILSNSNIYRTDLDGSIKIKVNNNGYIIKTCKP